MTRENDELEVFYQSLKHGITIARFLGEYEQIKCFIHRNNLTEDLRLARGRVKKLSDEIYPVARFVQRHASPGDKIWFALDDRTPDCCIKQIGSRVRQIEVTVAQARERLHLMTELNRTGTSGGFLGLSDDAPIEAFTKKESSPRTAYTTEEIAQTITRAIDLCAQNKANFQGDSLIIAAPLQTLPAARWDDFRERFAEKVKDLKFSEVYLTDSPEVCLRIK